MKEELPTGWSKALLSEVALWGSGGTPSRKNSFYFQGTIPWIKTGELGSQYIFQTEEKITQEALRKSSAKLFPKGAIGIAMYGATIGKLSIFGIDACTNQACAVAVPIPGLICKEFLYYFLLSERRQLIEAGKGGAQPNISQEILKNWQIYLPPFAEQKRIVAKIEELFSEIDKVLENLQKAQNLLTAYRQSILKNAFGGKLTEKWRKNNKETLKIVNPKEAADLQTIDNIFQCLPSGWSYTQLGTVIEEPKYGTSKKCTHAPDGLGVLRIPNITNGSVDTTDLKYAQFDDAEKASYNLLSGDILIIRSNGSASIVGKCALVTENAEKYLFAGYLIRLRPHKHLISPRFLNLLLSSHFLRTQIESKAKSTSGVNNINSSELQSLLIPICELKEQEIIVKEIENIQSSINEMRKEITNQIDKSNLLKQSILKKAFSGALVSQDLNDEPTNILLERIRAEKEPPKLQKKKSKQLQKVAV